MQTTCIYTKKVPRMSVELEQRWYGVGERKATLPREESIYSAKLYAVTMALNVITEAAEARAAFFRLL